MAHQPLHTAVDCDIMTSSAAQHPIAAIAEEVRANKIRLLFRQSLPGVLAAPALAALLSWGIWDAGNRSILLGWLGSLVVCLIGRLLVFVAYGRAKPMRAAEVLRWERPYAISLVVTTSVWGLGGAILVPEEDPVGRMFILFMMIAVSGGTVLLHSAFRRMAVWSCLTVLLPSIVLAALVASTPTEMSVVLAAATFMIAAIVATATFSSALDNSFRLTHELGAAYRRIDEREQHFRFIAEKSGDAIWTFSSSAERVAFVTPAVRDLLGFAPEELIDRPIEAVMLRDSMRRLRQRVRHARASGDTTFKAQLDLVHRDGHVVHVEAVGTMAAKAPSGGVIPSIVVVTHDISEMQRDAEKTRRLANHDLLTDLPNRRLLLDRLTQAIAHARREGKRVGVLFLDLDGFKPINDRHGHEAGDIVLRAVAERLKSSIRGSDTAARIGGDEFVIVLNDLDTPQDGALAVEKVRMAVTQPYILPNGTVLSVGISIGIALYPDHTTDPFELLRLGDAAMYQAKNSAKNDVSSPVRGAVPPPERMSD